MLVSKRIFWAVAASLVIAAGLWVGWQTELKAQAPDKPASEAAIKDKPKKYEETLRDALLEVESSVEYRDMATMLGATDYAASQLTLALNVAKVESTVLGVHVSTASPALRKHLRLPGEIGLLVDHVDPGTAAAEAGLNRYDVLHKFDDQLLVNREQLTTLVRMHKPKDKVSLTLFRDGRSIEVEVELKLGRVHDGSVRLWDINSGARFDPKGHIAHARFQNCAECHVAPHQHN